MSAEGLSGVLLKTDQMRAIQTENNTNQIKRV